MSARLKKPIGALKSVGKHLSDDPRLISYRVHSANGATVASDGELQTLVEILIVQVAQVANSIGNELDISPIRFFKIASGYYHAFYYQNSEVRVGAIAEKSMSLEDFKRLVA